MASRIGPLTCDGECHLAYHSERECRAEARAFKAAARRKDGKPAGYTWRLYNDPKAGTPKKVQTGSLRTPAWAHEDSSKEYLRILAAEDTNAAADRRHRLYNEWLHERTAREAV